MAESIKVVVSGCGGRMGSLIAGLVLEHADLELSGACERSGHAIVDQTIGSSSITVAESVETALEGGQVLVEFTTPEVTLAHAAIAAARSVALVVGTTGWDESGRAELEALANQVPIVCSPNMSIGVNALFSAVSEMARRLGPKYHVEVVEMHHAAKDDAPSGTAVRIGELIAEARGASLQALARHGREGRVGPRTDEEIGMHALRGGDVVGDHMVVFAGPGERVELIHRASSRETFARGALRAALFVVDQSPGLYTMQDVLAS